MRTKAVSWFKHFDFMVIDMAILACSFIVAYFLKFHDFSWLDHANWRSLFAMILATDLVLMLFINPYSGVLRRSYWKEIATALKLAFLNFLFACVIFYLFKIGEEFSREMLIVTFVLYFLLSAVLKALYKKCLLTYKRNVVAEDRRRLVLVTNMRDARQAMLLATADDIGAIDVVGFCLLDITEPQEVHGTKAVPPNEVMEIATSKGADEVVVLASAPTISPAIYEQLIEHGIRVSFAIEEIIGVNAESKILGNAGAFNTLELQRYSFGTGQLLYLPIKRVMDIAFGAVGCVFLAPILGVVKLCYISTGDFHPILYKQERIGQRGNPFNLYKVRTMVWNADEVLQEMLQDPSLKDEWNKNQKFNKDPRITNIGKFLRKTSLDEFPQFLNVLVGEMSLIGPRPLIPGELEAHGGSSLYNKVKPGITGWWGCNGRSNIDYRERLELEYYYVRNCSLFLDTLCALRTFVAILKRDGAQ